ADDRPDDTLVVERPEILERSAASGKDRHLGSVVGATVSGALRDPALQATESRDDARGRLLALYLAGDQDDPGERPAASEDVPDVAPTDAGRARDHADGPRAGRRRALAARSEQPLLARAGLEGLAPDRPSAAARWLHRLD